jgi:hypothetical protein
MRDSSTYWVEDLHNGGKLKQRTLPTRIDKPMHEGLPNRFRSKGRFRLHHPTAPAVLLWNGSQIWYCHGEMHREDGPAIIAVSASTCIWAWRNLKFKVTLKNQITGVPIEKQMPMEWLEYAIAHGLHEEQQMILKLRYHVVKASTHTTGSKL